jgi:hypothetical protein
MRPHCTLVCFAILATALLAPPISRADGAIYLSVDRSEGVPGTTINAFFAGCGSCAPRVDVYLAPVRFLAGGKSPLPWKTPPGAFRRLGRTSPMGKLRFTIPRVVPGNYFLAALCTKGCANPPVIFPASDRIRVLPGPGSG